MRCKRLVFSGDSRATGVCVLADRGLVVCVIARKLLFDRATPHACTKAACLCVRTVRPRASMASLLISKSWAAGSITGIEHTQQTEPLLLQVPVIACILTSRPLLSQLPVIVCFLTFCPFLSFFDDLTQCGPHCCNLCTHTFALCAPVTAGLLPLSSHRMPRANRGEY